ncbi:MAG: hypothetical protein LBC22_03990 [Endomicrobium sp.]|jgi:hypothetical protein|nr:hypothetical protein [Endomicrobium sp.]
MPLRRKILLTHILNLKKLDKIKGPFHLWNLNLEENIILEHIIKLPCHIYWLNRDNVYLGCNEGQAKDFGLKSKDEVKGKTNFGFHDHDTAVKLNRVNELIMSTGKP